MGRLGAGLLCAALLPGCAGSRGSARASAVPRASELLPARVRLLSNFEYEQSASALVGSQVQVAALLPPEARQSGYTRSADQVVSEETLVRLNALAAGIAHDAVSARLATLAPCAGLGNAACAAQVVDSLGRRAFRRPLTPEEHSTLLAAFETGASEGAGFALGVELLLRVLLVSPSFLYTTELGAGGKPGQQITLQPYEIASELSYTLQGGPPDEALLVAARDNALLSPGEREQQARRLIAESGTRHQFRRFVLEWLEVDTLEQTAKSSSVLADYDELKSHMLDETKAFVDEVMVHHGGSVRALLSADFASVDPPMARFYGLRGYGPEASLSGSGRLGILQQASFLSAHAHEDSSSPVKRGDFVLRRLLCETVKRPGEVGINIVFPAPAPSRTTRQRFDVHTASPECAGCHQKLDQIGFSFEEFDAAGQRRSTEHGQPIETQADVQQGGQRRHFADSRSLSLALASDPEVRSCFARQAFRYFSAGAPAAAERAFLSAQHDASGDDRGGLIEELLAFVKSDWFVNREVVR